MKLINLFEISDGDKTKQLTPIKIKTIGNAIQFFQHLIWIYLH